jgi:hypothetical protein
MERTPVRGVPKRVLNQIRDLLSSARRQPAKYSAYCDETGITQNVQSGANTESIQFAWNQVVNVFAYKRDCFAVDQICLIIETSDLNRYIEVREDDEGYERLIEQLPKILDGFPTQEEWLKRAALPPFETQWMQLYGRKS